jgi:DNA gyrase subunit A
MLQRAGNDAARPDWLEPEFGIRDGKYYLTEQQAQAILDLRLHKLTGLEHEKILDEYKQLLELIAELLHILGSPERLMEVIREELEKVRDEFGDERRTEITAASHDIDLEDLIEREEVVVTLSHEGYVKYQKLSEYEAQRRGGRGKSATKMKDEDFIEKLLVANTHDHILCFSTRGRLYWLKVYQLPLASRNARGRPIVNILPLEDDERITAILPIKEFEEDKFVLMATANGVVKKTSLTMYSRPRSSGIIAVNLNEGDELIGVAITHGDDDIMLFSDAGKVVRFNEKLRDSETGAVKLDPETGEELLALRPMGRTATGVRGIKMPDGQKVVSLIVPRGDGAVLTATENGYGKRTPLEDYPAKSRATQGVVSIKVSDRNGKVVGAVQVDENDEIMLISNAGTLVRTRVSEVSTVGRNTQGVRLIRTGENEQLVALQRIEEIEDAELIEAEGDEAEAVDTNAAQDGADESTTDE